MAYRDMTLDPAIDEARRVINDYCTRHLMSLLAPTRDKNGKPVGGGQGDGTADQDR